MIYFYIIFGFLVLLWVVEKIVNIILNILS